MTKIILVTLLMGLITLPTSALAVAVEGDMNYTYSRVKLTAYSAACRHDRQGGRNETSISARLKPRSHTLDGTEIADNVVVTAVPQYGGMASLYRCFFRVLPPPGTPADLKAKMLKKIFFAGDHYGRGSNNHMKIDISYGCSKTVNHHTFPGAKIQRLNCLPRTADVLTAINTVANQLAYRETQYADAGPSARSDYQNSIMSDAGAGR